MSNENPFQKSFTLLFFPLLMAIFITYLTLGLALAALPQYIHSTLGLGNLVVGIIIGLQSLAALLTRHFAGTTSDIRGSKTAVTWGAVIISLSGLVSLSSTYLDQELAVGSLMAGRLLLGLGESLLMTGALSWGIALVGAKFSGKVMAWSGIAMYGAIAIGAPLALALEKTFGIRGVFVAIMALPVFGFLLTSAVQTVQPMGRSRIPFYRVLNLIWKPGVGLALATIGFGGLASFATLYFAGKHWEGASFVLATFGAVYIGVRLFFAHLPDRHGGARVALCSLVIEVMGQACLWLAVSPTMAIIGAALTGAGFSLIFPAFGIEAVKKIAPENRGVAVGAYVAFFDLALGTSGPLAGMIANQFDYSAIYLFGGISAIAAAALSINMLKD